VIFFLQEDFTREKLPKYIFLKFERCGVEMAARNNALKYHTDTYLGYLTRLKHLQGRGFV
jgi:hypothetical protein